MLCPYPDVIWWFKQWQMSSRSLGGITVKLVLWVWLASPWWKQPTRNVLVYSTLLAVSRHMNKMLRSDLINVFKIQCNNYYVYCWSLEFCSIKKITQINTSFLNCITFDWSTWLSSSWFELSWIVYWVILNHLFVDFPLAELSTGWLVCWLTLPQLNCLGVDLTVAELSTGWF